MIDSFNNNIPQKFWSGTLGFGLHQQTSDLSPHNPENPSEAMDMPDKPLPGRNMWEQAFNKGNVFESRIDSPELEKALKAMPDFKKIYEFGKFRK